MQYYSSLIFVVICFVTSTIFEFFISDLNAKANMRVYERRGYRYIESDGLPDHSTGRFPNAISEQDHKFRMTLKPNRRRSPTFVGHSTFGVAVNGVPFDPATAEYWKDDRSSPWNIDAINGGVNPGLDSNNGHVQPNGAYHYHSIPVALMERFDQYSKPVLLGYAADGFAIYGPYAYEDANDMSSELINLFPSYRLKAGSRSGGPGGKYDGSYTADYEYIEGLGDLDQCNGRRGLTEEYPEGTYYYVITDTWPFIPRCWMGKPDRSFQKGPGKSQDPGKDQGPDQKEKKEKKQGRERRPKIDTRRFGIPARDAMSACADRRSGSFCSYRAALGTVNGTCRSAGADLVCRQIGR